MKPTRFVCNLFDDLVTVAQCNGFNCPAINAKNCFPYLDVFHAIVEADTRRILEEIADIKKNFDDYYDCGDWDELHREVLFNDKLITDLNILKDLETVDYADEEHYMDSLIIIMKKINSQLDAKNNGSMEYNDYYLNRLVDCTNEILELIKNT